MLRVVSIVLVMGFSAALHAQTVYKCKDATGRLTFSQIPCADDAEAVDTAPAQRKLGSSPHVQGLSRQAEDNRIAAAEKRCVDDAQRRIEGSAEQRLANYRADIARIEAQINYAFNSGDFVNEPALRAQIQTAKDYIETEQSNTRKLVQEAVRQCAETRKNAEEQVASKRAAEDIASSPPPEAAQYASGKPKDGSDQKDAEKPKDVDEREDN